MIFDMIFDIIFDIIHHNTIILTVSPLTTTKTTIIIVITTTHCYHSSITNVINSLCSHLLCCWLILRLKKCPLPHQGEEEGFWLFTYLMEDCELPQLRQCAHILTRVHYIYIYCNIYICRERGHLWQVVFQQVSLSVEYA